MTRRAVIAIGGNALTATGQEGTYAEQAANAADMATSVRSILDLGWQVTIVHGNGPQVGNLAIQQQLGRDEVPEMPLFALDAMTQGQLGSLLAIALYRACGRDYPVVATLSHVVVDLDDPAFDNPTKPIGPFYSEAEAAVLEQRHGWVMVEDAGRGHRRVVASPRPQRFVEAEAVRRLVEAGFVVVAGGGGGIPVGRHVSGWDGVDAVIDKDYAAAELALALGADALVLLTGVASVMLDFGRPGERPIEMATVTEIETHLAAAQFPEGSMAPKVRAAADFVKRGGGTAIITTAARAAATLDPAAPADGRGTRIVADDAEARSEP